MNARQMLASLWVLISCGSAPEKESTSSSAAPQAHTAPTTGAEVSTVPTNSADASLTAGDATASILPPCVMHAGEIKNTRKQRRGPGGVPVGPQEHNSSCAYNAECASQRGVSEPGGGTVTILCENTACTCRLETFAPEHAVREFSFEATCETSEQAQTLLKERCIAARKLPQQP